MTKLKSIAIVILFNYFSTIDAATIHPLLICKMSKPVLQKLQGSVSDIHDSIFPITNQDVTDYINQLTIYYKLDNSEHVRLLESYPKGKKCIKVIREFQSILTTAPDSRSRRRCIKKFEPIHQQCATIQNNIEQNNIKQK